jgi:hypothetical protein
MYFQAFFWIILVFFEKSYYTGIIPKRAFFDTDMSIGKKEEALC